MSYNPLHARIQITKPSDQSPNFEKKKQVQVIEETSNRSIPQQSRPNPKPLSINPKPATDQQKPDIDQILNSPIFYKNLLKYNSRIVSELSAEVHKELFEVNKGYLKKLAETHMASQMRKEMMDFKISFADFLKDFLQRQLNISMHSGDIEALKREIEALKSNSVSFNNTLNGDKSVMADQQFNELKTEIGLLRQTIHGIKESENRLEQKLDNTLADINKDSRNSIVYQEDHKLALKKINDQASIIKGLKDELNINQEKIRALESQVDFKLAALEQMVQRQHLDYSVSMSRCNDDQNNYFNRDDISFSIIKPKAHVQDETQLLDVKELNKYMGTGLVDRHSEFIAPDRPASPKRLLQTTEFDNYMTNIDRPDNINLGSKGDISGLANQYGFLGSEQYPRRTPEAPYTPDNIIKKPVMPNQNLIGGMRVKRQDLESSLADITLNNNTVEEILIDEHGFVIDHNGFPILDTKGNLIKLTGTDIESLKTGNNDH